MRAFLAVQRLASSSRLRTVTVSSICVTLGICFSALAGWRYTSEDGTLVVEYGDECSTTEPSAFYEFSDGTAGELVAVSCDYIGGDASPHKFIDTAGEERCFGRMTHYDSAESVTVWEVDGTVEGYSCSKASQTFEYVMDYPPEGI